MILTAEQKSLKGRHWITKHELIIAPISKNKKMSADKNKENNVQTGFMTWPWLVQKLHQCKVLNLKLVDFT